MTDVPDGTYALRVTVDPLQQIDEANEGNNVVEEPVLILRGLLTAGHEHTQFELPAQGNLFVELRLGAADRRFCASFGGETLRNDEVLVRRRDAPPTHCDTGG